MSVESTITIPPLDREREADLAAIANQRTLSCAHPTMAEVVSAEAAGAGTAG